MLLRWKHTPEYCKMVVMRLDHLCNNGTQRSNLTALMSEFDTIFVANSVEDTISQLIIMSLARFWYLILRHNSMLLQVDGSNPIGLLMSIIRVGDEILSWLCICIIERVVMEGVGNVNSLTSIHTLFALFMCAKETNKAFSIG